MKSIGNDIVALRYIDERRTNLPAFYSKFITAGEQQLHPAVMPFAHFVWLLWAVKESSYKYLKRNETGLVFSPSKIIIQNLETTDGNCTGAVCFQDQTLHFLAKIHPEYIVAVVIDTVNFEQVSWYVQQIDSSDNETQSAEVRRLALEELIKIYPNANLQITKTDAGYPVMVKDCITLDTPLSFAHHGNYVTYAFRAD